ncbi:MAG: hypothetical protein GY822_32545, partial [Deltaproteobacteria bacterium]|nr:hypothetical protein [Deltaproteobacteria bacterium]
SLLNILSKRVPALHVVTRNNALSIEAQTQATLELMHAGVPVIAQGCVSHQASKTYGYPDLIVRSDVLAKLFPEQASDEDVDVDAKNLNGRGHYRIVDIKFTTLKLSVKGRALNSGSAPAYRSQLFIYNRALGEMQGIEPKQAFLMGRGYEQKSGTEKGRGDSAFDRLAIVDMFDNPKKGPSLEEATNAAVDWARLVQAEGANWSVSPKPSVDELYPNMCNTQDAPWHGAKKSIAKAVGELTQLWQVGVAKRNAAHERGIHSIDAVTSAFDVDIKGEKQAPVLDAVLEVNRQEKPVLPMHIQSGLEYWAQPREVEFYVDFETVSDLDDDFSKLPQKNGQPLIFMIGCGHIRKGEWVFQEFTVDEL